jgi:DNA-binding MarR family transcriptional regulator
MNRDTLLSRLEHSMLMIGKGMHDEQMDYPGSSPAQNHVLMLIGLQGDMSIKQLAEKLRVTSGAVTQHVGALEKTGLLERTKSSSDRRGVVVKITQKGQDAFREIRLAKTRMLSKLFSELSDDELHTLVGLIEKVSLKYIENKKEQAHGTIQ